MNAGPDRRGGNDGERCCQGKVVIKRLDPGRADEGGQREGGLQHGEVVADTGARSAAGRQVRPAAAALRALRQEPIVVPSGLHCQPGPSWESPGAGALAVVDCTSGSGLQALYYRLFADQVAMDSSFNESWTGTAAIPCPRRGPSPQEWSRAGNPIAEGRVSCSIDNGIASVGWTIESELLLGSAEGNSAIAPEYEWWAAHYQ